MNTKKVNATIIMFVWIIGAITIWELSAWLLDGVLHDTMARQKLPYLHSVFITFMNNIGSLLNSSLVTVSRAFLGFVIGGTAGFIISILLNLSKYFEKMVFPHLIIIQMIPILALAPIVYNIVKNGDTSRIIIAAFITFFPVTVNTLSGLNSVEKDKIDLMYSYAAKKTTVYRKLMIPAALPHLFTGVKIAAPNSITAAILVEMLGTDKGIGVKILYSLYYGANAGNMFWASVITAAALGICGYCAISFLEKLLVPWERTAIVKGDVE